MSKWLGYRHAKSYKDVVEIIHEAVQSYEDYKLTKIIKGKEIEEDYLNKGIIVGALVKVKSTHEKLVNKLYRITKILRDTVYVVNVNDRKETWRLKNLTYEVLEDGKNI